MKIAQFSGVAVLAMGGQYSNLDQKNWWKDSILMPYMEFVADWLLVMAPKGLDLIQPALDSELLLDAPVPDNT